MSARPERLQPPRRAQRPALEVVRRKSRRLIKRRAQRRFAPLAIAVTICVAAVVFGVLLEQVILAQSAFKLERVRESTAREQARHEELLLESARLESPARIERYARIDLGMVDPSSVEYIVADVIRPPSQLASSSRSRPLPATGQAAADSSSLYDEEAP